MGSACSYNGINKQRAQSFGRESSWTRQFGRREYDGRITPGYITRIWAVIDGGQNWLSVVFCEELSYWRC
jgi:hypothetical protein